MNTFISESPQSLRSILSSISGVNGLSLGGDFVMEE